MSPATSIQGAKLAFEKTTRGASGRHTNNYGIGIGAQLQGPRSAPIRVPERLIWSRLGPPRHHMTLLVLKFIIVSCVFRGPSPHRCHLCNSICAAFYSISDAKISGLLCRLLAPYYKRMLMLLRPPSHLLIPTQPHPNPRPGPQL